MALGAVEAIEECGKSGEIIVVGHDGNDDAVEAVEAGRLSATIVQDPAEWQRQRRHGDCGFEWRGSGKDHLHTVYNGDQS